MADDVQPAEGQGDQGTGIFDAYLQAVPEEHRDTVTGYLKDAEKNVNERISRASELEKQWGPYQDIQNLPPPENLKELLDWSNATLTDQETFDQWVTELAEQKGMSRGEVEEGIAEAESQGLTPEQIQQQIDERAQVALQPFQEELRTLQEERGVDVEYTAITGELGRLEKEAKVELSEAERGTVYKLGMDYAYDEQGNELPPGDSSWVAKGFEEFKAIGEQANKAFVLEKASQPASAMSTGGTANPRPITSFTDANAALRERWKQMQEG